jgi:hypothetical protein
VAARTHELSTLLEIANTVASTLDLKLLVGVVLDQLKTVVEYTGTTMYTLERDALHILGMRAPFARNPELVEAWS